MCGISGFISTKTLNGSGAIITSMITQLSHRGPDSSGYWNDKNLGVFLGHRRLSIHDLTSEGSQPMISSTGRYVIVYNGEAYNFLNLRLKLERNNYFNGNFKGNSDTEVLLAVIEAYGLEKALSELIGMFAFALWDSRLKKLHLIRDRMGEKPLYYGWQGSSFLFGSELKSLRVHPHWKGGLDHMAVAQLLRYNYIPAPQTIYPGINKLKPGNMITLSYDKGQWNEKISCWWSLEQSVEGEKKNSFNGTNKEAVDELEKIIKNVLSEQQLADVPVGAFLSGGIDSSLVVSILQSISSSPVETFTIGSSNKDYDETLSARKIAHHIGTKHTEFEVQPEDAIDIIKDLPSIYDEPFADSSQIPTILVSRLAKTRVTVALSGDGGDEIFGGYNRYIIAPRIHLWLRDKPLFLRQIAQKMIRAISPNLWDRFAFTSSYQQGDKFHKVAGLLNAENEWEIYIRLVRIWQGSIPVLGLDSDEIMQPHPLWGKAATFSENMMLVDSATYLPDDILVKLDRAAMSSSLETRVPLLDHRITTFAASLPLSMKIYKGDTKWILRKLLSRYLPNDLTNQPKIGFGIPLHDWLRGPLREWAEDQLSSDRLTKDAIFDPIPIRQKWKEHLSGRFNHQNLLWGVLMFQVWLEENHG
jgi:asparagine synthase (glutamine-hydrolysing)